MASSNISNIPQKTTQAHENKGVTGRTIATLTGTLASVAGLSLLLTEIFTAGGVTSLIGIISAGAGLFLAANPFVLPIILGGIVLVGLSLITGVLIHYYSEKTSNLEANELEKGINDINQVKNKLLNESIELDDFLYGEEDTPSPFVTKVLEKHGITSLVELWNEENAMADSALIRPLILQLDTDFKCLGEELLNAKTEEWLLTFAFNNFELLQTNLNDADLWTHPILTALKLANTREIMFDVIKTNTYNYFPENAVTIATRLHPT